MTQEGQSTDEDNAQTVDVAVKMLNEKMNNQNFKSILKEIKVLAYVGEHENVIKFYGAMVDKIADSKEY